MADAVRQVRLALLDADVNYGVVSQFIKRVKEKALGDAVLKSISPGEQFTKLVHDELVALMGTEEIPLEIKGVPHSILMCGLQGSGKTTQCAKLAVYIQKRYPGKKVLLAACDLQRPAAIQQLKVLAAQVGASVCSPEGEKDPVWVAKKARAQAQAEGFDFLIVDTAGRLHLDEELMTQLALVKAAIEPHDVFFVASANTGQDAVKTAVAFDQRVAITGTILTMLDGNARAGAAISIREVTGKSLRFEGVGEKVADLQPFNPHSMADRILGMGDVINLVRKAEENFSEKERGDLEKKLLKAAFTYDDYLKQMSTFRKMGPLKSLLKMLPGMSEIGSIDIDEKELDRIGAMIQAMTPQERAEKVELIPSRRRRMALGSGTSLDDVNRMVKGFKRLKQFCKEMPALKKQKGDMRDLMGKMPWK